MGRTTAALNQIALERKRQVEEEGWTLEHDDEHGGGEMGYAAACYGIPSRYMVDHVDGCPTFWPWSDSWWKPTPDDRVRELVKAGALIVAEIERIQRESGITVQLESSIEKRIGFYIRNYENHMETSPSILYLGTEDFTDLVAAVPDLHRADPKIYQNCTVFLVDAERHINAA